MVKSSFFIRFTPRQPVLYTLSTIQSGFEQLKPEKYVIGKEQASSEHYHIAIFGVDISPEALRYQLKKIFEGQIYISGKEIIDKIKAIAYCLKDGNYLTHKLDINEFLLASATSRKKIKYEDLLKQAEEEYTGSCDDKKFIQKLLEAHISTNKKVYLPHIRAQLLLTKLKKEQFGTYKEYLIEKILDNL